MQFDVAQEGREEFNVRDDQLNVHRPCFRLMWRRAVRQILIDDVPMTNNIQPCVRELWHSSRLHHEEHISARGTTRFTLGKKRTHYHSPEHVENLTMDTRVEHVIGHASGELPEHHKQHSLIGQWLEMLPSCLHILLHHVVNDVENLRIQSFLLKRREYK